MEGQINKSFRAATSSSQMRLRKRMTSKEEIESQKEVASMSNAEAPEQQNESVEEGKIEQAEDGGDVMRIPEDHYVI